MRNLGIAITTIVASLLLAGTALADTIHVPGDHTLIQDAINASSDGDVINIAAGTYNEHSLNPGGKAITIGSASGNLDVTIDANGGGRVFAITSGEYVGTVIKDLVITGGSADYGGGIYCSDSSPTITGCTISGNTADISGGGIYCRYSSPTISGCTISDNTTSGTGGGIRCYHSDPTITGCTISDNTANSTTFGGGGILCDKSSSPTITGCTISGNEAHAGGGIYCRDNSSPTITGCTISDNTANDEGGGIYCYSNSSPTITGCTISDNTANEGGGIYHFSSSSNSILTDTIVCGNDPDQIHGDWTDDGGNTIQDECPICPGDATGDFVVDVNDVLYVISAWDTADPNADFDEDGLVDADDILILLSNFGETCP